MNANTPIEIVHDAQRAEEIKALIERLRVLQAQIKDTERVELWYDISDGYCRDCGEETRDKTGKEYICYCANDE